jgi:hypothetical protein
MSFQEGGLHNAGKKKDRPSSLALIPQIAGNEDEEDNEEDTSSHPRPSVSLERIFDPAMADGFLVLFVKFYSWVPLHRPLPWILTILLKQIHNRPSSQPHPS